MDGLSAAERLHRVLPECRTLVLTGFGQPGNLLRALQVHVRGFIVKDAPAATLADGVRRVAAGERVIDPDLIAAAIETGASPLTAREADVLRVAETGVPTEQIATALSLSPATVRNYLSNAIRSGPATASTPSASPAARAGSSPAAPTRPRRGGFLRRPPHCWPARARGRAPNGSRVSGGASPPNTARTLDPRTGTSPLVVACGGLLSCYRRRHEPCVPLLGKRVTGRARAPVVSGRGLREHPASRVPARRTSRPVGR
jgi:DNA-binding CsgD family transcriptional regulator